MKWKTWTPETILEMRIKDLISIRLGVRASDEDIDEIQALAFRLSEAKWKRSWCRVVSWSIGFAMGAYVAWVVWGPVATPKGGFAH
jgi:hypothetical protein